MTLTLVAVYVPIGFMAGTTGRLFTEFAWTLAGAVLVSGFVALTLSPVMCSQLLSKKEKPGVFYRSIEWFLRKLTSGYRAVLGVALRVRPLVVLIGLGVAASSHFLFNNMKSELAPYEDQGTVVSVFIAPEGSTIQYTYGYAKQLEDIFAKTADVDCYFVITGFPTVSQGIGFVKMTPGDERTRSQFEISQE